MKINRSEHIYCNRNIFKHIGKYMYKIKLIPVKLHTVTEICSGAALGTNIVSK